MLRDRVVETIRNAILDFSFKPGDRLIERELCEDIGVSRTSVREALRHLESEGLVRNIPNKGPIVADITYDEAMEIYEVREAMEGLAVKIFTERASDEQIKALQECFARAESLVRQGDMAGYFVECTELMNIIFAGSGNAIAHEIIVRLKARVALLRTLGMSDSTRPVESLDEFSDIVAAIARRDPLAARNACESHVRKAAKAVLNIIERKALAPA